MTGRAGCDDGCLRREYFRQDEAVRSTPHPHVRLGYPGRRVRGFTLGGHRLSSLCHGLKLPEKG